MTITTKFDIGQKVQVKGTCEIVTVKSVDTNTSHLTKGTTITYRCYNGAGGSCFYSESHLEPVEATAAPPGAA